MHLVYWCSRARGERPCLIPECRGERMVWAGFPPGLMGVRMGSRRGGEELFRGRKERFVSMGGCVVFFLRLLCESTDC